jgi:hypothetical protein
MSLFGTLFFQPIRPCCFGVHALWLGDDQLLMILGGRACLHGWGSVGSHGEFWICTALQFEGLLGLQIVLGT